MNLQGGESIGHSYPWKASNLVGKMGPRFVAVIVRDSCGLGRLPRGS